MQNVVMWGNSLEASHKVKHTLDPTIPLASIYPRERKTSRRDLYVWLFTYTPIWGKGDPAVSNSDVQ